MENKPYRRKPKGSRKPPIWRFEFNEESLQNAILDAYLYHREYDPGYTRHSNHSIVSTYRKIFKQSVSVHVNYDDRTGEVKSVTLLAQQHVVRWNKIAEKHFLRD